MMIPFKTCTENGFYPTTRDETILQIIIRPDTSSLDKSIILYNELKDLMSKALHEQVPEANIEAFQQEMNAESIFYTNMNNVYQQLKIDPYDLSLLILRETLIETELRELQSIRYNIISTNINNLNINIDSLQYQYRILPRFIIQI